MLDTGTVREMRKWLAGYRVTVLGWILLVLVPVLVLVAIFGPHGAEVPSLIAAPLLALFVAGGTFAGARGPWSAERAAAVESVENAAAEFGPRDGPQRIEAETYDPEAWRRERERRERDQREQPPIGGGL